MSSFGLAKNLGHRDASAAAAYIDKYFQRYPGVKQYMDDTKAAAKSMGYVETAFGRRLYLPEINSPNGSRRAGAERAAINAPMQGTAADLIKLAMVAVQKELDAHKPEIKMIMQVHDELVFELPESEVDWLKTHIPRLMAEVAALKVPLLAEVGVGANWDKAHRGCGRRCEGARNLSVFGLERLWSKSCQLSNLYSLRAVLRVPLGRGLAQRKRYPTLYRLRRRTHASGGVSP